MRYKDVKPFSDRKVSTSQALRILRVNGIEVTQDQAVIILDFLYLIAKTHQKLDK